MPIPHTITCVDCGEPAHLIQTVSPGEVSVGDIVAYRCSACLDRWDVELTEEDLDEPPNPPSGQ
jgi:hypothetical protein